MYAIKSSSRGSVLRISPTRLLSTDRGRLNRVGQVQGGCLGCTGREAGRAWVFPDELITPMVR